MVVLTVISVCLGCAAHRPPVPDPVIVTPSPGPDPRVITALDLTGLRILAVEASIGPTHCLAATVRIENAADRPAAFTYHLEWFDRNGMPLHLAHPSVPAQHLGPHAQATIGVTASTPEAADFQLKFVAPGP